MYSKIESHKRWDAEKGAWGRKKNKKSGSGSPEHAYSIPLYNIGKENWNFSFFRAS